VSVVLQVYTCPKCRKSFNSKAQLRKHSGTHMKKIRGCPNCDKKFTSKSELKKHIEVRHSLKRGSVTQYEQSGFFCCNRRFRKKEDFDKHTNDCHRKVTCGKCNNEFENKRVVCQHQCRSEKTESSRPYCKICDMKFSSVKDLVCHEEIVHQRN
jgi:hypothetical protein